MEPIPDQEVYCKVPPIAKEPKRNMTKKSNVTTKIRKTIIRRRR